MLKNYLNIALRQIGRHPGYTFINVMGLAAGLAVCMMMLLYVRHELSYDRFHEKSSRTYRVMLKEERNDRTRVSNRTPESVAPALAAAFPEVERAVRLRAGGTGVLVGTGDTKTYGTSIIWSDPGFFDVFTYQPIAGSLDRALESPGSAVITQAAARKFYGDEDPIGQTLTVENKDAYTIRAVVQAPPANSHLHFDVVLYRMPRDQPRWNIFSVTSYVVLRKGIDAGTVEARLPAFVARHASYSRPREHLPTILLQPIETIHLHPSWGEATSRLGPIQYLYLVSSVALLVLLIACVNFMNLATARSARRAREVGIRKAVGAHRGQLTIQFLGESVVTSIVAYLLALLLVELSMPVFNAIVGVDFRPGYPFSGDLQLIVAGLVVLVGVLSGSYPAFFLSRFRPSSVLKGSPSAGQGGARFRKVLVVFQFGASVMLILATLVIHGQMRYVRQARLDANDEEVLVLKRGSEVGGGYEAFKQALLALPEVADVSTGKTPGSVYGSNAFEDERGNVQKVEYMSVGLDYAATVGLRFAAGRPFVATDHGWQGTTVTDGSDVPNDKAIIVNEAAVRWLDLRDPIDQYVPRLNGKVIGVVRDFHMLSMYDPIDPLVIEYAPTDIDDILVRLRSGALTRGLAEVQATWRRFVPDRPPLYSFLDDELDQAYLSELRLGHIFSAFAVLAIVIACLGLFGLAAYTAEQRTKEIGIRKVLGASVANIIVLLSRAFAGLVVVAFVVASPLGYLALQRWLDDFAYRIDISAATIVGAGAIVLAVALLTVGYQAVKAGRTDPVKALRYE